MTKYTVSGIVLDKCDNRRSFRLVVVAHSRKDAWAQARRELRLSPGDLVRDVQIVEIP